MTPPPSPRRVSLSRNFLVEDGHKWYLAKLPMVELDEVAEGVQELFYHDGTVSNQFFFEKIVCKQPSAAR